MSKAQIYDFWSPTCGPCKALEPHIEAYINANEDRIEGVSVNTASPEGGALASQHSVRTVPTLILVRDGRELARSTGIAPNFDAIAGWVNGVIGTR